MFLALNQWPNKAKTALYLILVFLFLSETMALIHYSQRIGHGNELAYFQGNEESAADTDPIYYPKSLQELLDVAHPHAFGFVFYFALLAVIWSCVTVEIRLWRAWLYGLSFCILGFLLMPFIIRFGPQWASGGYAVFGIGLTVHLYIFIATVAWQLRARP